LIVVVQLLNSTRSSARVNLHECCSQCWTWQEAVNGLQLGLHSLNFYTIASRMPLVL